VRVVEGARNWARTREQEKAHTIARARHADTERGRVCERERERERKRKKERERERERGRDTEVDGLREREKV